MLVVLRHACFTGPHFCMSANVDRVYLYMCVYSLCYVTPKWLIINNLHMLDFQPCTTGWTSSGGEEICGHRVKGLGFKGLGFKGVGV